jgi:glyoxylase-like metal-dependent hydrolase (beta-lactamase superfamily II)
MANVKRAYPENVAGNFYVDDTCIDCDLCRQIAPKIFAEQIEAEQLLEGTEPIALDRDFLVIPVPGHTRGHVVFLYKNKFLFTGDHLAWSDRRGGLIAFRDVAWYSWQEQTKSMKHLLDYPFQWVLPGHGRRAHRQEDEMRRKLAECIKWMEKTL